jgi:hypothetical protein
VTTQGTVPLTRWRYVSTQVVYLLLYRFQLLPLLEQHVSEPQQDAIRTCAGCTHLNVCRTDRSLGTYSATVQHFAHAKFGVLYLLTVSAGRRLTKILFRGGCLHARGERGVKPQVVVNLKHLLAPEGGACP